MPKKKKTKRTISSKKAKKRPNEKKWPKRFKRLGKRSEKANVVKKEKLTKRQKNWQKIDSDWPKAAKKAKKAPKAVVA